QWSSRLLDSAGVPFDVSLSLATTASGPVRRLRLIVTDLRALLDASGRRDQAEHENRKKDEYLAIVAHELRSPIGTISSAVQVLEALYPRDAAATRAHEMMMRQIDHLSRLVEELLDVERSRSGKMHL